MTKREAYLSFNKALDLMGRGAPLQTMHTSGGKREWFVLHRAGGRVRPADAEKIKSMPNICPQADGLFDGCPQTYRMG